MAALREAGRLITGQQEGNEGKMSRSNKENSPFISRAISKIAAVALFLLLFSANAMAAYTTVAFKNLDQWVNGVFTSGSNTTNVITSPSMYYFMGAPGNKTASNASGWAYYATALAAPPVPVAYTEFQVSTSTTYPFDINGFDVNNQTGGAYAITVTSYSDSAATNQIQTQNFSVATGPTTVTLNGNHLSAAITKITFASTASISFNNFQLQFSTSRRVTANPSGTTAGTVTITSNTGAVNCTWNGTAKGGACTSGAITSGTAVTLTAALQAGTTIAWGAGCDTTTATTCTINSLTANTTISPVTTSSAVTFAGASGTSFGDWALSGNADFFTATQADGASGTVVRLTPATATQKGMLVYNKPFSSAFGDTITFDYYMGGGTGADGIAFFLVDGTQTTVTLGKSGGTLGYGTDYSTTNGVPNAYAAVGFDVYGNGRIEFGNSAGTGPNNGGALTNNVCIVGSGNGTSGYRYITGIQDTNIAGGWRKVEVTVERGGAPGCTTGVCLSVRFSTNNGSAWTSVYTDYRIDNLSGQATIPDTFKLGFSASTGGATNNHYIDNVVIDLGGFQLDVVKAGTGTGTVTSTSNPTQTTQLNCGSTCAVAYQNNTIVTLTATPALGSNFTSWSGDCSGTSASTSVTMSAAKSCTATFTSVGTYTVTTTATNGTITSTNNPTVTNGSTTTVTGSANANYYFTGVSGCSGTTQSNTDQTITTFSYTTGAITANCTVTATFAIKTYTVTTTATNGTITSTNNPVVNHGSTTIVTGSANTNYYFTGVSGCNGTTQTNATQTTTSFSYTTGAITGACTVTATFAIKTYTVTPSAGTNGTISPATVQTVNHGSTKQFTVTPSAGYTASVGGTCGGTLSGNTYTTNAITANCTVDATFTQNTYTVTPSAGANGSISPSGAQTINYGSTAIFTVTPNSGYTASVSGTCGGTLAGAIYTTNAITANCTVDATFTQSTYTITPSANAGGTISPNTVQTLNYGSTTTFTITPDPGYTVTVGGTCGGTIN